MISNCSSRAILTTVQVQVIFLHTSRSLCSIHSERTLGVVFFRFSAPSRTVPKGAGQSWEQQKRQVFASNIRQRTSGEMSFSFFSLQYVAAIHNQLTGLNNDSFETLRGIINVNISFQDIDTSGRTSKGIASCSFRIWAAPRCKKRGRNTAYCIAPAAFCVPHGSVARTKAAIHSTGSCSLLFLQVLSINLQLDHGPLFRTAGGSRPWTQVLSGPLAHRVELDCL